MTRISPAAAEVRAVIWKEWSQFRASSPIPVAWLAALVLADVGVLVPLLASSRPGVETLPILIVGMIPTLAGLGTATIGISAERDAGTLEALMASPLPARALLGGKALMPILVAVPMGIALLVVQLLTLRAALGAFPEPDWTAVGGSLVLGITCGGLASAVGLRIGLHSRTARAAQVRTILLLGPLLLLGGFTEEVGLTRAWPWLARLPEDSMVTLTVSTVIAVAAFAVLAAAARRFSTSDAS